MSGRWRRLAAVGEDPPACPADGDAVAPVDAEHSLVLRGRTLPAEDQRVLSAFAAHVGVAYRQHELQAAAAAVEPLAESERQRTALLNAVSHDLRTPIAAAKAAVTSLRAPDVTWSDAERRELLATADTALNRLTDLVTNLLDLSRLQAGVLPVLPAPVGLDDIVSHALDGVPGGHAVELDLPADLPAVEADAGLLERVVANLVQNALRYSPAGQPVHIGASAYGDRVELRVVDRGPGIPAEDVETVFAAFRRVESASPNGGSGLGLGTACPRTRRDATGDKQ